MSTTGAGDRNRVSSSRGPSGQITKRYPSSKTTTRPSTYPILGNQARSLTSSRRFFCSPPRLGDKVEVLEWNEPKKLSAGLAPQRQRQVGLGFWSLAFAGLLLVGDLDSGVAVGLRAVSTLLPQRISSSYRSYGHATLRNLSASGSRFS